MYDIRSRKKSNRPSRFGYVVKHYVAPVLAGAALIYASIETDTPLREIFGHLAVVPGGYILREIMGIRERREERARHEEEIRKRDEEMGLIRRELEETGTMNEKLMEMDQHLQTLGEQVGRVEDAMKNYPTGPAAG